MSRSRARVAVGIRRRVALWPRIESLTDRNVDVSRDGASARDAPRSAWTHDARNRVAVGRGVRLRYVSRADVKFMHDEIFERECYGCDDDRGRGGKGGRRDRRRRERWMSALWFAARSDVVIACEPIPRTFAALVENVGARENRGGRDDDEGRGDERAACEGWR